MHQEIRKDLEEFLKDSREIPAEFHQHLGGCGDCANELREFQEQSQLLRSLQSEAEPRAGFYARVMERIEAQQQSSIWSALLERKFGFRLALASGMLAALLGFYLVTSEPSGPETVLAPSVASVQTTTGGTSVDQEGPRQEQQRDAVLVNLASYRQ
jgi:anti-sigma factor RsiW